MQILGATALLLDIVDLGERDRIATFLTAEHGKRRGVARGSRAKYSRFAGQLQLLSKVRVSWFEKDGSDLVRLSDVELLRPAAPLLADLEGIFLVSYLAEHLREMVLEDQPAEKPFRLLDTTLEALLAGADRNLAVRYFEIWMLRLSGIFPIPRTCPLCDSPLDAGAVLAEPEAALICPACGEGQTGLRLRPPEIAFLQATGRNNLEALSNHPPPTALLARIEDLCGRVRRSFLESELRSYRVMRETLGGTP